MSSTSALDRESFWRSLLLRRDELQLTVAQVCEQAGVSPASYYQWQRKLRSTTRSQLTTRTPTRTSKPSTGTVTSLVPVRIIENRSSELTLELPRGLRLSIPANCDEATLQRVLRVALASSQKTSTASREPSADAKQRPNFRNFQAFELTRPCMSWFGRVRASCLRSRRDTEFMTPVFSIVARKASASNCSTQPAVFLLTKSA